MFEWFFKKLSPSQEFNALLQQKEKQEMPADTEVSIVQYPLSLAS